VAVGLASPAMWFVNHVVNRLVRAMLRSPLHPLLSGRLVLLRITGRRTGRSYEIPVIYTQAGDELAVQVALPERKRWWRNFEEPGAVAASCAATSAPASRGPCATASGWACGSRSAQIRSASRRDPQPLGGKPLGLSERRRAMLASSDLEVPPRCPASST
jgi:hypothetical protein